MRRPRDLFDREHEWHSLERFVDQPGEGAALGLVYGRRRQGKTFLLESMVEAAAGVYFAALQQSEQQNLERLSATLADRDPTGVAPALRSWEDGLRALLAVGQRTGRATPVVIDELPYLLESSPALPSMLQALLSPRSPSRTSPTRLVLCGSAFSVMRSLLSGTAPLRGRASLELVVHPFDLPEAAQFWGAHREPELAVQLHALVGGTPAYLGMSGGVAPSSIDDLDEWVVASLLDPSSAMVREGDVLLAEEQGIVDRAVYLSLLAAISQGRTRRGEIAAALGRPETALAHPLTVLREARLIEAVDDALRQKRTTFRIAEPILRLHQLIIAPNGARIGRRRGAEVWAQVADTVSSRIYGPHLEDLARWWTLHRASEDALGGTAARVAPAVVPCREHGVGHEIDVVALDATGSGARVLALGEATWQADPLDVGELDRLDHLRGLVPGADGARLLLTSRAGFTRGLRSAARRRGDVELVDLARLVAR